MPYPSLLKAPTSKSASPSTTSPRSNVSVTGSRPLKPTQACESKDCTRTPSVSALPPLPGYSVLMGRESSGSLPESILFARRLRSGALPYRALIVSRISLTSGSTNGLGSELSAPEELSEPSVPEEVSAGFSAQPAAASIESASSSAAMRLNRFMVAISFSC